MRRARRIEIKTWEGRVRHLYLLPEGSRSWRLGFKAESLGFGLRFRV